MNIHSAIEALGLLEAGIAKVKPLALLGGPAAVAVLAGVDSAVKIAHVIAEKVEEGAIVANSTDKADVAARTARLEAENDELAKLVDAS